MGSIALFKVYYLVGFVYTYRQRNGFLVPFKNGFNAVLWFCLHVLVKKIRGATYKHGDAGNMCDGFTWLLNDSRLGYVKMLAKYF